MEKEAHLQPPPLTLLDRYHGEGFTPLYSTTVTVSGGEAAHGRASGVARSDDGNLVLDLRLPAALGGPGGGTNPEQLFAAGFAACFHGALSLIARRERIEVQGITVVVQVAFGRDPVDGGYALTAEICVRLPGVEKAVAEELVRNTERMCPYAKLAREGMHSVITVLV
ncbi:MULTISPECIES: Ohr family peroxiredoxin [unclassified Cupriavidus]|uniref:Ohr family peroxiredoxin n=1 Tax=unclassified Cupriavidus TaxID=2640874 RepID=UPI0010F69520|nr:MULTISPECIES: Ohr family peroxiredoxin [unclassified Cupriavidus]MWL86371.1 Ohr family peroxiredoxin [Cupriavidus sp. SW-Y-13]